MLTRRAVLGAAAAAPLCDATKWATMVRAVRGQTVRFAAPAEDGRGRAAIAWAGERVCMLHGIRVRLVPTPAEAADLLSFDSHRPPPAGGRMLPIRDALPNAAMVECSTRRAVPWRRTQMIFVYDAARGTVPPGRLADLPHWAASHPRRMALPPHTAIMPPSCYAALRPHLWSDAVWPFDPDLPARLASGMIDIYVSLNPGEPACGVAHGVLPPSVRSYAPDGGAITGRRLLGIPADAARPEAALVLANFLLSPEAQAHFADPRHLGSPTVLRGRPDRETRYGVRPNTVTVLVAGT